MHLPSCGSGDNRHINCKCQSLKLHKPKKRNRFTDQFKIPIPALEDQFNLRGLIQEIDLDDEGAADKETDSDRYSDNLSDRDRPDEDFDKDVWAVLRENIHRYQDNFSAYLKAENRFKKKKELVIQEPIV